MSRKKEILGQYWVWRTKHTLGPFPFLHNYSIRTTRLFFHYYADYRRAYNFPHLSTYPVLPWKLELSLLNSLHVRENFSGGEREKKNRIREQLSEIRELACSSFPYFKNSPWIYRSNSRRHSPSLNCTSEFSSSTSSWHKSRVPQHKFSETPTLKPHTKLTTVARFHPTPIMVSRHQQSIFVICRERAWLTAQQEIETAFACCTPVDILTKGFFYPTLCYLLVNAHKLKSIKFQVLVSNIRFLLLLSASSSSSSSADASMQTYQQKRGTRWVVVW